MCLQIILIQQFFDSTRITVCLLPYFFTPLCIHYIVHPRNFSRTTDTWSFQDCPGFLDRIKTMFALEFSLPPSLSSFVYASDSLWLEGWTERFGRDAETRCGAQNKFAERRMRLAGRNETKVSLSRSAFSLRAAINPRRCAFPIPFHSIARQRGGEAGRENKLKSAGLLK